MVNWEEEFAKFDTRVEDILGLDTVGLVEGKGKVNKSFKLLRLAKLWNKRAQKWRKACSNNAADAASKWKNYINLTKKLKLERVKKKEESHKKKLQETLGHADKVSKMWQQIQFRETSNKINIIKNGNQIITDPDEIRLKVQYQHSQEQRFQITNHNTKPSSLRKTEQ